MTDLNRDSGGVAASMLIKAKGLGDRVINNIIQQTRLTGIYQKVAHDNRSAHDGRTFLDRFMDEMNFRYSVLSGAVGAIPTTGPLMIVANHPYGMVDGLILGHMMEKIRPDVKLVANKAMQKFEEIADSILPIMPERNGASNAVKYNRATVRATMRHVDNGGAVIIFPAGAMSVPSSWTGPVEDKEWQPMTAHLLSRNPHTKAVPVFIEGHNSVRYQFCAAVGFDLGRRALIPSETLRMSGREVGVHIGPAIGHNERPAQAGALTSFLREQTYALPQRAAAVTGSSPGRNRRLSWYL